MKRGYKETEIGEIPEEWEVKIIRDFSSIRGGKRLPLGSELISEKTNHPYIRIVDIHNGCIDTSSLQYVPEEVFPEIQRYTVDSDDIIITIVGTIGLVANIPPSLHKASLTENAAKLLTERKEINNNYLLYFLSSRLGQSEIFNNTIGTSQMKLPLYGIEKIRVILPPLPEQKKIAEVLSSVDESIRATQAVIEQAKVLKQGMLNQLLTKGIGHKKFKQTEIGEIPEEWEVKTLESVSEFITKGATPTTYGYGWSESGILFLRSECVSEEGLNLSAAMYITEDAHSSISRSEITNGDILMTITGYVGRCIIVNGIPEKANINQHIARIRLNSKSVMKEFIFQFLSSKKTRMNYEKIVTGQAYPQISLKQVRDTIIPIPPLSEQKKIANLLSSVDDSILDNTLQLNQLKLIKSGLMQDLLSGKKRVKV